jgi:hypothetical protein
MCSLFVCDSNIHNCTMNEDSSVRVYDLTIDRKFIVFHNKGESCITFEQYDNCEGTGVPKQLILTSHRWQQLSYKMRELTLTLNALRRGEALSEMKHLGGGYYASLSPPYMCVNIRKYHMSRYTTDLIPTQDGIALRWREWDRLSEHIDSINKRMDIDNVVPCAMSEDHADAMTCLMCSECNPYGNQLD